MTLDAPANQVPLWPALNASLLRLGFSPTRSQSGKSTESEPVYGFLVYVPAAGRIVASLPRSRLPTRLSADDLKSAKVQAVFKAYIGRRVDIVSTDTDVYFGIPVTRVDTREADFTYVGENES